MAGPTKLNFACSANYLDNIDAIRAERVTLVQPRAEVSLKVNGSLGEATMQEAVYGPILDYLADHQPRTLGEIERVLTGKANLPQVLQATLVLCGSGALYAVQDAAASAKAKPHCDRLNAHLLDKARGSSEINYLASPVTGGGITVGRFQQLFLLALRQGKDQPAAWADFVWQILAAQNQRLLKEGKALETAEENLAELTAQAQTFAEKQLPILKSLQIA